MSRMRGSSVGEGDSALRLRIWYWGLSPGQMVCALTGFSCGCEGQIWGYGGMAGRYGERLEGGQGSDAAEDG